MLSPSPWKWPPTSRIYPVSSLTGQAAYYRSLLHLLDWLSDTATCTSTRVYHTYSSRYFFPTKKQWYFSHFSITHTPYVFNGEVRNSNTPRLYSQSLNSVIYSATNHWAEARDAIWHHSDIIVTLCWRESAFLRLRLYNIVVLASTMQ